jgi:hypothetical protein
MQTKTAWFKSKTIWYAIISGVAGVIAAVSLQYPEIAVFTTLNSVIGIVLRFMSTTSITTS